MAIGSLGSLVVSMALDTARFEGDLGRAAAMAERRARQISRTFNTLQTAITGGLFAKFIGDAAAAGDEMVAMAERTGRSVESLSQLEFVAKRGNTTIQALLKSQDQLAKVLGATDEEGKKAAAALAEIGLNADRIRALSPDAKLEAVAEAMSSIEDPAKRARIEMALFGKAGTEIDQVLRGGANGIRALREESDRLGITVTDLEAKRLAKLDDQLEATKGQFNRLKLEIAGILAQPIGSYLEVVSKGLMGWRVMLGATGEEMEELNDTFAQLTLERQRLQTLLDAPISEEQRRQTRERLEQIREEMGLIAEKQEFLFSEASARARFEAKTAEIRGREAAAAEATKKKLKEEEEAAEKTAEAYAKWRRELTELVEHHKRMNEVAAKFPTSILSESELERQFDAANDRIQAGAKESQKTLDAIYKGVADDFKGLTDEMTVVADQAWRNIQDGAADFLFDPFEKGLKGMLSGFLDVLRRMIAEMTAAQILGQGSSGGGFLGSILRGIGSFLGGRGFGVGARLPGSIDISRPLPGLAKGGFLRPGQLGIVGEEGPELAFGGRRGMTVEPGVAARPIVVHQSFHFEAGADTARLFAFAEQVKQDTLDTMSGLIRGGAFAT